MVVRKVEMDFEYMNYIPKAPRKGQDLYMQACSNDKITIHSWRDIWLKHTKLAKEKFGSFKDNGIGKFWGKWALKPAICMGSGPSLKDNGHLLKNTSGVPIISCLHNYHFCVDNDIKVDIYVTLDAGDVVLKEIAEGGKLTEEEYWESTKDKTLFAYVASPPELWEKWKGKVYLFAAPIPDPFVTEEMNKIEPFHTYVSSGGNVLGACVYIAKAFLGANPITFVGADFSFSYLKKFHAWDSQYDKELGQCMRGTDVYGNNRITWQSYFNFKCFFDWLAQTVPGLYINCTEGGMLGAYPEGNIQDIMQMDLSRFLRMYSMHEDMKHQCTEPEKSSGRILY